MAASTRELAVHASWDAPVWRVRRDNEWAAGCRLLQSWWRRCVLDLPAGPVSKCNEHLVCSMLPLGENGANFLDAETRAAVEVRLADRSGMIHRDRLLRNLLSSQPTCFNLFGPFVAHPNRLLGWVRTIDPSAREVDEIRFEWAPDRARRFDGGSAFDAFVEYRTATGSRFLAVECKYAEDLAASPIDVRGVYIQFTHDNPCWKPGAEQRLDVPGHQKIWRNVLLAQSLVERDDRYEHGFVVVVACAADGSAREIVEDVRAELTDPDRWLHWSPYERVLRTADLPAKNVEDFTRRYLDFSPVEHLLEDGDPRRTIDLH